MRLFRISYVSNHGGLSEGAIDDILLRSQSKNRLEGITGTLLFSDQDFFQTLEGDHKAVYNCLMRVLQDKRHRDINILHGAAAHSRIFPQWSMHGVDAGIYDLEKVSKNICEESHFSGFLEFLQRSFSGVPSNVPMTPYISRSNQF